MPKKKPARREQNRSQASDGSRENIATSEARTADQVTSQQEGAQWAWRWWYALCPPALAVLTSLNTLWSGFAADDTQQVLGSAFIRDVSNLPLAFTTSVWSFATSDIIFAVDSYYRPLFNVLFTLNYALFGTAPLGWHLMNALVHGGVTLLVFIAFREVTVRPWLALTAATLFGVHPSHAESVAWVSGATDPLMALFLLPAFYFYVRYKKRGRKRLLALMLGFYFLALMSKETAIALPLLIVCCDVFYFKDAGPLGRRIAGAALLGVQFAAPTAIYFFLRYNALGGTILGSGPRYSMAAALSTVPLAVVKYLKLMVVPAGYSYQHYTDFVQTAKSPLFILPLALLVALGAAIVAARSRLLVLSALWFIVPLAPALAALRQLDPEYLVADRYLYLPSVGLCVAAALGIERLARSKLIGARSPMIAAAATAAMVIVFGQAYVAQNRVWADNLTLYKNCARVEPRSAAARTSLAYAFFEAGLPREADAEALAAMNLDPQFASAYLNLSYFAHASGKLDKAIEYLEEGANAIPEGPMTRYRLATIHLNLGLLYSQRKEFTRARESMLRSVEIWPRSVGWYYTGQFYFDQGQYEDALDMFTRTSNSVSNRFAAIYLRLGWTYDKMGQRDEARAAYERFLHLAPASDENRPNAVRRLSQLQKESGPL